LLKNELSQEANQELESKEECEAFERVKADVEQRRTLLNREAGQLKLASDEYRASQED
tara:strand:- start:731 stop:904 length:174 start_codon:yes stop_codon:yes gene_type:complete